MIIKLIRASFWFLSIQLCLVSPNSGYSQKNEIGYPVVGEVIPDFKLNTVQHYSKQTYTPNDTKGKWVIIDFWSRGCSACVQSFPRIDSLQKEFKTKVQFILVANNDRNNKNIGKDYERYREHFNLSLPIAYDSVLFQQFGIQSVPHVVIVNPEKKVYAVTTSNEVTKDNLIKMIAGEKSGFSRKINKFEKGVSYPQWKPFADDEVESKYVLLKSVLVKNDGEPLNADFFIDDKIIRRKIYEPSRLSLMDLYRIAYFSNDSTKNAHGYQFWYYPILETKDSQFFTPNYNTFSGLYNYGLLFSEKLKNIEEVVQVMRKDLASYFGYTVRMEKRMMPYYKLTATEKAIKGLKIKSQYQNYQESPTGIDAANAPVESILRWISLYNSQIRMPFVNETNLGRNIGIKLEAVMNDIDDVARALKIHGLILEKSEREMNVLVISDPETKNN